jgi:DNA repair protein RecO (recombination protein O)
MSGHALRVELAPGLVLHQRPWRDTSMIVELFTAQHGRLTAFARGVRGSKSAHTRFSALRPFQPLLLSWFGRGEAPRLIGAEPDGALLRLPPAALLSAWYLNELLLKLTAQHDPQPGIFRRYAQALQELAAGSSPEWTLRRFEKQLLELLGFGLDFSCAVDGDAPIDATEHYRFVPGVGFAVAAGDQAHAISGRVLLGLATDELFTAAQDWREARSLMRAAIDHCLDGRELRTRQVARAVVRAEGSVGGH